MPVNYQAVIRDNQGLILANENVDIRFTIIQGSPTGSSIYLEDHKVKTNQFGLVNIELGTGLVLGGDFYTIDWSLNNYYLKLELQKNNGAGFIDLGTSKFNAVPFANYALNAGNVNNSDTSASNELQIITLSNNNLELSKGGGVVDLSPFLDNTDNQTLTRTGNQITISGGNSINLPTDNVFDGDSSVFNELQAISFVNDTLTLTNGGKVYLGAYNNSQAILFNAQQITNLTALKKADSTLFVNLIQVNSNAIQNLNNQYLFLAQKAVSDSLYLQNQINTHVNQDFDLDSLNEIQIMSISNDTIYLSKSGFIVLPTDEVNDGDFDNTNELQILSISNDTLSLSNGGFVVLPDNVDDADNNPTNEIQVLSISNDTLYLSSGGFAVLPTDKFEDSDADSLNEIQMLSISNDSIFLSNGGFIVLPPDDDGDSTNEIQTITISNDTVYLSNGGSVKLPVDEVNDADFDSNNEIQFISISGDSLKLSNGGYVDLSNYDNSAIIQGLIQKISNDSLQFQSLINSNTNNLSNLTTKRVIDSTLLTQRIDTVSQNISNHVLNDLDKDTLNEIQVISISNDTLFLDNGGFVDMADFRDYNKLQNKPDSLSDFVNDMGFLTNQNTSTYQIGDTAFGGVIFYVSPSGTSGLVAALQDQSANILWGEAVSAPSDFARHDSYGKQFTDWRVPSRRELALMYQQRQVIGKFFNDVYWAADEYDDLRGYAINFGNTDYISGYGSVVVGDMFAYTDKDQVPHRVRSVRSFGSENIIIPENLDNDSTNEIQNLSISGDTLSISKGNSILLNQNPIMSIQSLEVPFPLNELNPIVTAISGGYTVPNGKVLIVLPSNINRISEQSGSLINGSGSCLIDGNFISQSNKLILPVYLDQGQQLGGTYRYGYLQERDIFPVMIDIRSSPYTVPNDSLLILTNVMPSGQCSTMYIDGAAISNGGNKGSASGGSMGDPLASPIVVNSGSVINTGFCSAGTVFINGYLVPK